MYKDFVKICEPIKKIRADYPFEVKEVGPFTQPTRPGGTDASVFGMEGVPTLTFTEEDFLFPFVCSPLLCHR